MKKKKVIKSPSYLRRRQKGDNSNLAFFDSPYFKYVIAGAAVILIILIASISYLHAKETLSVLGAHTK